MRVARTSASQIAHSTADQIEVHGLDLTNDLMGVVNLGDMAFLELRGRLPDARESTVINALLVTLVEHGLTPSALVGRLTLLGAPESIQAAVAAGLLGLGNTFVGSIEGAARMVQEGIRASADDIGETARGIVEEHRSRKALIPGLGHPVHRQMDPRSKRLFEVADENAIAGRHVELMRAIGSQAEQAYGRALPVNATGAIGAVASDLEIPWRVCRALGVMARAVGLAGHLLEEMEHPIAPAIVQWAEHGMSVSPSDEHRE
jgi:citrate synthase